MCQGLNLGPPKKHKTGVQTTQPLHSDKSIQTWAAVLWITEYNELLMTN